jgi:hypothetical protein
VQTGFVPLMFGRSNPRAVHDSSAHIIVGSIIGNGFAGAGLALARNVKGFGLIID